MDFPRVPATVWSLLHRQHGPSPPLTDVLPHPDAQCPGFVAACDERSRRSRTGPTVGNLRASLHDEAAL